MRKKVFVTAVVAALAAGLGLSSPAQAFGATRLKTVVVTNAAKSAKVEVDVWRENDTGKLFVAYYVSDLKADGASPRGRVAFYKGRTAIWAGTQICGGGKGKECDYLSKVYSPSAVSTMEVEVWNGASGKHVLKTYSLP